MLITGSKPVPRTVRKPVITSDKIGELMNVITTKTQTLEDLQRDVLNWEPQEVKQYFTNPLNGELVQAQTKTIYRVKYNDERQQDELIKLGEVGVDYETVNNSQRITATDPETGAVKVLKESLIEHVRPIAESGLVQLSSGGELLNGRKVFACFEMQHFEPVPGDERIAYASYFNSHDGSTKTGWVFHTQRIVCENTFRLALSSDIQLSTRHNSNVVKNLDIIRAQLDLVSGRFAETNEQLAELAKIQITDDMISQIVRRAFSKVAIDETDLSSLNRKPKVLDPIRELFEAGKGQDNPYVRGTGLALFEAVSEYLNHESGANRKVPTTQDARYDSLLFGESRKILAKTAAIILALRNDQPIEE